MRVLFSAMRMTGHIRPLIPYAYALMKRGHEVLFASPEGAAALLRDAGLAHAVFGHPGDELLGKIWATVSKMPADEMGPTMVREVFANFNARAALPDLRKTFRSWKPDVVLRESMEFAAPIVAAENSVPLPASQPPTHTQRHLRC